MAQYLEIGYNISTSNASALDVRSIQYTLGRSSVKDERLMAEHTPLKRCSKCGVEYPATREFFRWRNDIHAFRADCIACSSKTIAISKAKDPNKKLKDKEYREKNREKINQSIRQYYIDHPDKALTKKENDKQHKNKPKSAARTKAYRLRHPDKIRDYKRKRRIEYPEEERVRSERRRLKYPEKIKAANQRHRARKLGLPTTFTATDWQRALNYLGGCCAACGRPPGLWHFLAQDHWIPLSDPSCPGTIPTNIIPLCHGIGGCNNSKSNKKPDAWLTERFGKRKANQIIKIIAEYFKGLK